LKGLSAASGVSYAAILRFEGGKKVWGRTPEALRATLEKGGAKFVEIGGCPGVLVDAGSEARATRIGHGQYFPHNMSGSG
jgi:hypothetical protein